MKRLLAWVGLLALVLAALGQKAPGLEALLVRVLLKEVALGEEVRLALPTGEVALRGQAEGVVVEVLQLSRPEVEGEVVEVLQLLQPEVEVVEAVA